jgi:hypothetical protein
MLPRSAIALAAALFLAMADALILHFGAGAVDSAEIPVIAANFFIWRPDLFVEIRDLP